MRWFFRDRNRDIGAIALNATILHSLGYDHAKLTVRPQGRDFRLTDVHGHGVEKLLA